jgi:hypothetical protein
VQIVKALTDADYSSKVGNGLLISLGNNLNFRRWPGELGQNRNFKGISVLFCIRTPKPIRLIFTPD